MDVPDAQWFCNDCQLKRRERPLETGMSGEGLSLDVVCIFISFFLQKSHMLTLSFLTFFDRK